MAINLTDPIFNDEDQARAYFEEIRWPHGVVCPHCGNADGTRIYSIAANAKAKIRAGLRECQDCHGQFTVRTGSVMESSHLPLIKWAMAYRFMASSKKGMSAHQLHRSIGVTYKTAWFMWHRIREAMRVDNPTILGGPDQFVEVDETYIGTKPGKKRPRGGHSHKHAVVALVERKGRSRTFHVEDTTAEALRDLLEKHVSTLSHLRTDELRAYTGIGWNFASHETVHHSAEEWVRGDAHTNTVEGFFSVFKRGMKGIYQHCGEQHLQRYLDEFDFRYSNRVALGVDDTERTRRAIKGGEGKRLTYRPLSGAQ